MSLKSFSHYNSHEAKITVYFPKPISRIFKNFLYLKVKELKIKRLKELYLNFNV